MSAAVKSSGEATSAPGRSNMVDAKREEFRKYLEKEGILESLTKALVTLYEEPEKPNDALGYLKNNFAGHASLVTELRATKTENGQLKQKVDKMEKEKFLLKEQLSATEAKLKAAMEKAEEKVKDKEEPKPAAVEEKRESTPFWTQTILPSSHVTVALTSRPSGVVSSNSSPSLNLSSMVFKVVEVLMVQVPPSSVTSI